MQLLMKMLLKANKYAVKINYGLLICVTSLIASLWSLSALASNVEANIASFSAANAFCQQAADGGNVCVYQKNAKFIEENTKLWAPEIRVYRDTDGQLVKIEALADNQHHKAHYQGLVDADEKNKPNQKKPVDANANDITIYPSKNLVLLNGDAYIKSERDVVTGAHIEYNLQKHTMLVDSGTAGDHSTITLNSST